MISNWNVKHADSRSPRHPVLAQASKYIITMLMSGNWLTCFCLSYKRTANALCIGSHIYISSHNRSL